MYLYDPTINHSTGLGDSYTAVAAAATGQWKHLVFLPSGRLFRVVCRLPTGTDKVNSNDKQDVSTDRPRSLHKHNTCPRLELNEYDPGV
ncbi:hypothetical protein ElyMa_005943400 [Elysia marginata]|uniref:Carbohydrate kinase PfkB domain-containing protein n=1 Tax=Elysia marginata TaxID=1093978 RepID=A0AAV4G989_9GAST|nr:hypothetical protein ElyMa_005943400 [Elysia marginata]